MIVSAIVLAEIAFWVVLLAGLTLRYVWKRPHASTATLLCVPVVDLLLVVVVMVDLVRGARPSTTHALAAVYLGVTVAFGHSIIKWADTRFRHRFAGGPAPSKPRKGSRGAVRAEWAEWFRLVLADVVAGALLLVMIAIEGFAVPRSQAELTSSPFWSMLVLLGVVTVIWFVAGPATARSDRHSR